MRGFLLALPMGALLLFALPSEAGEPIRIEPVYFEAGEGYLGRRLLLRDQGSPCRIKEESSSQNGSKDRKFLKRGTATFYGCCGDGYLGRHPASYWHGKKGLPARVNLEFFGVATTDRTIPFGAHLRLTIDELPSWAKEEYAPLRGRSVEVIVIDRMQSPTGQHFDLWPAAARQLMGPDFQRIGRVFVLVENLPNQREKEERELLLQKRGTTLREENHE